MSFKMKNLSMAAIAFAFGLNAQATIEQKSRAGLQYSMAFSPAVSKLLGEDALEIVELEQLIHGGIAVEVPYNKYLTFGFGFDVNYARSPYEKTKGLHLGEATGNISTVLLGLSGLIKPQLPLNFSFGDLLFYGSFKGGFGGSSAITFGTEALSRYKVDMRADSLPTPFPLYFETTATAGIEYFFSSFIGLDVGFGYKTLWVMHPMVKHRDQTYRDRQADRSVLWYDITAPIAVATLKLTF